VLVGAEVPVPPLERTAHPERSFLVCAAHRRSERHSSEGVLGVSAARS
jgi:hypothetical protein